MKYFLIIFLLATLPACCKKQSVNTNNLNTSKYSFNLPANSIIDTKAPLILANLNIKDTSSFSKPHPAVKAKIEEIVNNYYRENAIGDSVIRDSYIKTLQLKDGLITLYVVLLKHLPGEQVNSKILFFDNKRNVPIGKPLDFNLFALYDFNNCKLEPSNLKRDFKIRSPEIELILNEKEGINEFKFTRLYHNGTANAIETTLLRVANNRIDTLNFKRKWIGAGSDHL